MIKRILSVILTILLIGGIAFAAPGYRKDPGTGDILGQGRLQSDPHKIFRMVRYVPVTYSGATALGADSIVTWSTTEDDGITVTTTTTSYDSTVAGIIVQAVLTPETDGNTAVEDMGLQNWTWLQTYGLSQADMGTCSNTVKDALGTSTTAGKSCPYIASASDPKLQGKAGFFLDSGASAATNVEVFLIGLD